MKWVRGFNESGFLVPSFLPVGLSAVMEQSWDLRNLHRLERFFFIFSSNLDMQSTFETAPGAFFQGLGFKG